MRFSAKDGDVYSYGLDRRGRDRKGLDGATPKRARKFVATAQKVFHGTAQYPSPKPGAIAAADMQSLWDPGLLRGIHGFGPFANETDFHNFLHFGLQKDFKILTPSTWVTEEERKEMKRMVDLQDGKAHKICFTHGDINSSNILVKGGKIVGLIDFEYAGFYPEYWEYTCAMNGGGR